MLLCGSVTCLSEIEKSQMKSMPIQKLYYSIRDVSQITDVKQHVLRYWESEFGELKPAKNRAGNRTYRSRDIKVIFLIKKLLYEEKFTIEGAKAKVRDLLKDESKIDEIMVFEPNKEIKALLQNIRNELLELKQKIEEGSQDRGVAQPG